MELVPSASGTTDYMLAPLPEVLDNTPEVEDGDRLNRLYGPPVHWRKHCITCEGKKEFKTRLGDGTVVTVACDCRGQWLLNRWMQLANIDRMYARLSWGHVKTVPPEVLAKARDYALNLERNRQLGLGMTLWSDRRGTGKTMLTTLILKEAMAQGRSVYFSTFLALIDSYSRTWKDPLEASWFRRRVDLADVIALDDMGKESAQTSASIGMIDQFVDRILRGRVSNARITFATSNLDPESTQVGKGFDRYQQDVLELLSEVNEIVEVGGESFRREQQRQKMADFEAGVVYPVVLR